MSNMDAHGLKSDQKRDWDAAAAGWQKWRPVFEWAAQHVRDRLVELAGVKPGDRVLAIAAGNGAPAVTRARRAGGMEPLRMADTAILKSAVEGEVFKNSTLERLQVVCEFASPDAFTQFRRDVSAPFRALPERQTPERRDRILAAVTDAART